MSIMEHRSTDSNAAYLPPYLRPYSYPAFSPYSAVGYGGSAGYPLPYSTSSSTTPPTNYVSRPLPSVTSIPTPSPTASPESSQDDESRSPPAKRTPPPLPELPHLFRPINFETSATDAESRKLPPTPDSDIHSDTASDATIKSATSSRGPQSFLVSIPRLTSSKRTKDGLTLSLLDSELWKSFHSVGNEMIVTKPGRRLFPALLVSLKGLDPTTNYSISLRMFSADQYRYKFLSMHWVPVGESEVIQNEERQVYKHPNSSNNGQFWMKKPISFKAIKITHNSSSKSGNILLHTMHKYSMEVVVRDDSTGSETSIEIPETTFIAVTAYQNTKLTQLKIDNNPFAKGFRDRESAGGFVLGMPLPPFPSPYGPGTSLWQQMPPLPPVPTTGPPLRISPSFPLPEESSSTQKTPDVPLSSYHMPGIHPLSFPPHPYSTSNLPWSTAHSQLSKQPTVEEHSPEMQQYSPVFN